MEAPQYAHRFRHRLRRKQSATEDAFTQSSDFAVFMDFFQPPRLQARNFQANGIRSDVNGSEGGHRGDDEMLTISILTPRLSRATSRLVFGGKDRRFARPGIRRPSGDARLSTESTTASEPLFNRFVTTL